jgi:hypothetical protein
MKKFIYLIAIITLSFTGCKSKNSTDIDKTTGLTTEGSKLTCGNVFISINGRKVENNVFTYGERFYVNYDDIKGLSRNRNKVLPGMKIAIINSKGDTIMKTDDVYSEITDGFELQPFQLAADLTVASPIQSGNDYTLFIKIWDKKGKGNLISKFDFKVKTNEQILAEPTNVTYNEIYIYSQKHGKVVRDGRIKFDDNIYIILEGLKGLKADNGKVFPGLSLRITDSKKALITDFGDLFAEYSATGVDEADVFMRASAKFKIEQADMVNPLDCEVIIWDKKSPAKIKIKTVFTVD